MDNILCFECGTDFTMKKNLYAHLRNVHNYVDDRDPVPKKKCNDILCRFCGNSFSSDSNLHRHFKNVHNYRNKSSGTKSSTRSRHSRLICPQDNCSETFPSYTVLRKHLQDLHEVQINLEELEFSNISDFEHWKNKMQQQTSSFYTLDTGSTSLSGGSKRKFFNCHRSYNYQSKGRGIKSLKSQGSNKIGKACPSRIEITYRNDKNSAVYVKFWKSHCGHSFELGHIILDKQSRGQIAESSEDVNLFNPMNCQSEIDIKSDLPESVSADLVCRTCACTSEDLVTVFGDRGSELQLLDKIHTHLPILVTAEDLLPVTLCVNCIYKLEMCHEFVKCCLEADAKLRTYLCLDTDNEVVTEDQCSTIPNTFNSKYQTDDKLETSKLGSSANEQVYISDVENTDVPEVSDDQPQVIIQSQDINVQVDSSDQLEDQYSAHLHSESDVTASKLNFEDSRSVESYLLKKNKSKFKVVVVKMKNTLNMTRDAQIEKALDLLKNVQIPSDNTSVGKLHFARQGTLDHLQEQELSGLESSDIELPDELTASLLNESSSLSLPVLSNEDTRAIDLKTEPQVLSDTCGETISTVFAENKECDVLSKAYVDHSYTRWDQTVYCCMYCKKTVVGKDNLASHQTTSHPDKVFCCPECDIIIYESRQFFDEHKKAHFRKTVCENTVEISWHNSENFSNFTDSQNFVPENDTVTSETFSNRKNKDNFVTCETSLLQRDLMSDTVLPLSEPDSSHNERDVKNEMEIVEVGDICIEPDKTLLKKDLLKSNSKFSLKVSKGFENIDSSLKSKIIGTIRGIIKQSKNAEEQIMKAEYPLYANEIMPQVCNSDEILPQSQAKPNGTKYKVWRCKQCNHISTSRYDHQKHVQIHPPVSFQCSYCDKQFPSKIRLQFHTYIHTREKPFICEYCGKGFRNRQTLKNHLYTHDEGEKIYECQDCGRKFGTKGGFDSHCASHAKASYLCDLCGKKMKHVSSLRLHRMTHLDPNFFRRHCCTLCGKTCRNKYLLTEHMRIHTNERPFKCVHCVKCFHKRSQLSQHMLIHNNARQHKCSVCGKGFNRLGNMKVHAKTHLSLSKFMCKICKKTFKNLGELISHRKTHSRDEVERAMKQSENQGTEPLMYVCDVCGKQLASKLTLKYHMMIHVDDKPFSCEICGKRFALKAKLQLHQKVHSSEKPFQCHFCSEGFQTKQYQIIHERIHTGEKPYKCTQCDKAFRSRMSLNQHIIVHSDVRPFKCSHCDKSFRRRDTLDAHLRTHTGERPYSCNICGRSFKQKGDCNKHQRTHFKGHKVGVQLHDPPNQVVFNCFLCGLNCNQKEEFESHFESFHTSGIMVPSTSNTGMINSENLVGLPEIMGDTKALVLPSFVPGCDTS